MNSMSATRPNSRGMASGSGPSIQALLEFGTDLTVDLLGNRKAAQEQGTQPNHDRGDDPVDRHQNRSS